MSIYCETIKADESGLTLAAQLLDGDGVALGDPITTGFTELATDSDNITHYWFAADIDLTTVKGIRFYDTGDATNFHTRTLKIAAAQTAATAAQSAAEAVETLTKADGAGDLAAIKTQTDKLSFTGTDVKATLDGEEVTPTSASKTGYSLTAAYDAAKTAGTSTLDAAGVRAELSTELGRIDAAISSRHAAGAAVAKSPATLDWSADVSNPPTIGDATAANQTTMLNRIGTFTGTGINTIFGFFKALMSKAADTPTDIGGTFSPATDSVEAIRDTPPIGTEMRGTDGANTVTPPTVEAVAAQLERDGGPLLVTAETVVENLDAKVSLAGSPAGEGSVDLTITCSAGGVPQDGVAVWLYLDDQYSQIAHGPLYSNAHGTVVFHVDPPAPYYAKLQRGGLNFPNQTLVWNEDEQRYETE